MNGITTGGLRQLGGSGQKQGQAPYEACGATGKPDLRWRGYQRMKFSMSMPFSTAQRTSKQRWVVERMLSWLHQMRRLRTRFERRADIHQAFLTLGCALICWNHLLPA
jgi:transposase